MASILDFENELRIVLLGKTGNGKSATGNCILGQKVFQSSLSGNSVTKKCNLEKADRFGKTINVVDTPGLFDTECPPEKTMKEIIKCIMITSPGPHAFVLVLSTRNRFTEEEEEVVKKFAIMFGDEVFRFFIVLFTGKDDLERDEISEDKYKENVPKNLKDIISKCNSNVVFFNNFEKDVAKKDEQVSQLLDIIDENLSRNGGKCYTNDNFQEAERIFAEREKEIRRNHEEKLNEIYKEIKKIQLTSTNEKYFSTKIKTLHDQISDLTLKFDEEIKNLRNMFRKDVVEEDPGIMKPIFESFGNALNGAVSIVTGLVGTGYNILKGSVKLCMKLF